MAEKLKLQTNIPEIIALEWAQGREVESSLYPDSPPQIMFSLVDGRKWFAPKTVAAKVDALQPAKGEALSVCKREGANKSIFYEVERYRPQQSAQPLNPQRIEAPRAETTSQVQPHSQISSPHSNEVPQDVERYIGALRDALFIAYRVQTESRDTQFTIEFGAEDVRAMGTTLYIERSRNQGGR